MIKKLIKNRDVDYDYISGDQSELRDSDKGFFTRLYQNTLWYLINWPYYVSRIIHRQSLQEFISSAPTDYTDYMDPDNRPVH